MDGARAAVNGIRFRLDTVAERLRRWTANPLGSPCAGSNPVGVDQTLTCEKDLSPETFLYTSHGKWCRHHLQKVPKPGIKAKKNFPAGESQGTGFRYSVVSAFFAFG